MSSPKMTDHELLAELLAVIHGDGGHYRDEHGTEKAVLDAINKAHAKTREIDRLREDNRILQAGCDVMERVVSTPENKPKLLAHHDAVMFEREKVISYLRERCHDVMADAIAKGKHR